MISMSKRLTAYLLGLMVAAAALPALAWVGTADLGTIDPLDPLAPYHQTGVRTLSPDTLYTLHGLYYVTDGAVINIPPATVILGTFGGTLVIQPGGQIFATGTETAPVVMTSNQPAGLRNPGDWGGVVILGRAPVNQANPLIEGGIIEGTFGGTDPHDSSGVFKYVRIEYPGYRFQLNNEINGLTSGGVGDGTEVHHVQVSYSFDDSYEWFGGTVNPHHLVAFGGTDDEFDTDFGFQGKLQFVFGLRDPEMWDPNGSSNGFESDNDGTGTLAAPRTFPIFSNVTLCGPLATRDTLVTGNKFATSATLRRSTRTSVFNSVIAGYPKGMSIRDAETQDDAWNDTLRVRNLSLQAITEVSPGIVHETNKWADVATWYDRAAYNNTGTAPRLFSDLLIGASYPLNLNDPDAVPQAGSELIGSADFSDSYLQDPLFTPVSYRGAFDPALPMSGQWTAGWTNFDPQNSNYASVSAVGEVPSTLVNLRNHPNPFNPSTSIKFSVPRDGQVTLSVFDIRGRRVATLADGRMSAGDHDVHFDGTGLSSGTYFYRLVGEGYSRTGKMQMVK
ncbi:hypothetical protein COW53_07560 [bacterium CG17_big_fil_post_rev_8_21_14_2_50_64_8]|nr:MAG: hypothetical protein COW53_07560 [bacterium CG17_big_fil_post_rev_8_21_14_2_50_64_8]PJA73953.1 MAG: hypothetical protein CO151_11260 [bacterium CG_4_9_14_3_um_filter_65_15]